MARGVQSQVEHPNTKQRRGVGSPAQQGECSRRRDKKQEFNVDRARRVAAEAAKLGDVIHQITVVEVGDDVPMKLPAERINERRKQRCHERRCETPAWSGDRIYNKDGWTKQETSVKIGPHA